MGVILDGSPVGEAIAIAMLLAATGLIRIQIVARELFNVGLPWGRAPRYAGLGMTSSSCRCCCRRACMFASTTFSVSLTPLRAASSNWRTRSPRSRSAAVSWASYWFMQRAGRFSTPAIGNPTWCTTCPRWWGMALTLLVAVAAREGSTEGSAGAMMSATAVLLFLLLTVMGTPIAVARGLRPASSIVAVDMPTAG